MPARLGERWAVARCRSRPPGCSSLFHNCTPTLKGFTISDMKHVVWITALLLLVSADCRAQEQDLTVFNRLLLASVGSEIDVARSEVAQAIGRLCDDVRRQRPSAQCSVQANLSDQPGFEKIAEDEIAFSFPRNGWSVHGDISERVAEWCNGIVISGRCIGVWVRIVARLHVDVTNLRGRVSVGLRPADNPLDPRPQISNVNRDLKYDLRVTEDHDWPVNMAQMFSNSFTNPAAEIHKAIKEQASKLGSDFFIPLPPGPLTIPGPPRGLGGPPAPIANEVSDAQLSALADSLERNIVQTQFLPDMNLLWDGGDQAVWSGHYLAAQALRYASAATVEERTDALQNAARIVQGIADLLDLGATLREGLVARTMRPDPEGKWGDGPRFVPAVESDRMNPLFVRTIRGVRYVGESQPTQNQYLGLLLGQALAYEFIDDVALKDRIRSNLSRMINGLKTSNFHLYISSRHEDLDRLRANYPGHVYFKDGDWIWSETFAKDPHKLLAMLAVDQYVNGDPSGLAQYGSIAPQTWLPVWIDTFDTHGSYFKFNLDHGYLFLLMRYDPDGLRRSHYARALDMLAYATGHHQNPYFELLRLLSGNGSPLLADEALNGLKLYTRRGGTPIDNYNDHSIEKDGNLARYPLAVDRRHRQGYTDFLWQRSPFDLQLGEGGLSTVGIDYLLAYRLHQHYRSP